jgi:hypothetical protein
VAGSFQNIARVWLRSTVSTDYGDHVFAIRGSWGTHYDGAPPGPADDSWFPKFIIGALPQLIFGLPLYRDKGTLFRAAAVAINRGKREGAAAEA